MEWGWWGEKGTGFTGCRKGGSDVLVFMIRIGVLKRLEKWKTCDFFSLWNRFVLCVCVSCNSVTRSYSGLFQEFLGASVLSSGIDRVSFILRNLYLSCTVGFCLCCLTPLSALPLGLLHFWRSTSSLHNWKQPPSFLFCSYSWAL